MGLDQFSLDVTGPGDTFGSPFFVHFLKGVFMRRYSVRKSSSARKFRANVGRTKAANVAPAPMRGGYRL